MNKELQEELMQRADIALYEAKNGKNQVCVYRKEKCNFRNKLLRFFIV